jgi:ESCRT-II complex subunit VPS22
LSKKAEEIKATSFQSAVETVEKLQGKLADFAKEHKSAIQDDPAFRQQFLQMCGPLGVDPLVSTKSFWAKTLGVGMGDFYYELAVKIAEICFATRSNNGGILSVKEVHRTLNRKKKVYNASDIPIAVKKLGKLGGGFRIVKVGKSDMIVSVPTELDQDHMEVMTLAQDGNGCVTADDVMGQLKWSKDRTDRAVTLLMQEGMAWKDDFEGISFYWFPSVWKESMQVQ